MAYEQARRSDELMALLEKYSPRLSLALRSSWEQGQLSFVLERVSELLRQGRVTEATDLVLTGSDALFRSNVENALRAAFLAAAEWAWETDMPRTLPKVRVFRTLFDQFNEETINAMKKNELRLVQEVRKGTRDGLRALMEGALKEGVNPREIARSIRTDPGLGLTESQELMVQRYKAYLRTLHEKRSLKELGIGMKRSLSVDAHGKPIDGINRWRLRDMRFDRTLAAAQRNNRPLTEEQISKMATAYRRRFLQLRSETIARTEMIQAGAQGSRESWRQMQANGFFPEGVRRFWFTSLGDRVCPYCRPMPRINAEGRGLDEPFMDGQGLMVDNPPLHPGCRCVVFVRAHVRKT
jgi:hypothetical protein